MIHASNSLPSFTVLSVGTLDPQPLDRVNVILTITASKDVNIPSNATTTALVPCMVQIGKDFAPTISLSCDRIRIAAINAIEL